MKLWFARALGPLGALAASLLAASRVHAEPPARAPLARLRTDAASATDAGRLGDFADPFVLRRGGDFFAFATAARGENIQVARSPDLRRWRRLADALPALPSWQTPGFTWAPSVLGRPGGYVLYYTTRDAASGFQCISLARSTRPEGPYRDDSSAPFVCQRDLCGSIDPSPFVDADRRAYLLWKSDENAPSCRGRPRLWAQRLANDGTRLEGPARALLAVDRPWEGPLIEAPSMLRHRGTYYVFYSGNRYEGDRYAVGYGRCASPLGPCVKATADRPLLASAGGVLGPGGLESFDGPGGRPWVAFHAWSAPRTTYASGGARTLRLAPLRFDGGVPVLEAP